MVGGRQRATTDEPLEVPTDREPVVTGEFHDDSVNVFHGRAGVFPDLMQMVQNRAIGIERESASEIHDQALWDVIRMGKVK